MAQVVYAAASALFAGAQQVYVWGGKLLGSGLLSLAASTVASAALAPKMPKIKGSPISVTRDPAAPRRVIYGRTRVGGNMVFASGSGTNNEYLHLIVALAGHPIDAVEDVLLDDKSTGTVTGDLGAPWTGHARVESYTGATGQRHTTLEAALPSKWTSAHNLSGIAHVYARLKFSTDVWPGGIPMITAVVRGKKLYDPRTSTTVWSRNAALAVRDYLTDTVYGLGATSAEIDEDSFIAAANICDENVPMAGGGTEERYTVDGAFDTSADPKSVLEQLLSAMAGTLVWTGGKWVLRAGAWEEPTDTLTIADLAGPVAVQARRSKRDLANGIKGTFLNPGDNYQPRDFPALQDATALADDGDEPLWRDVQLPFTTSASRAQRLAKATLQSLRRQQSFSVTCNLGALRFMAGDTIEVTLASMGWTEKPFVVRDWALRFQAGADGPLAIVQMTLQETDEAVWAWTSAEEEALTPAPLTDLPSPWTVQAPTALTLDSGTGHLVQGSDGSIVSRIHVSWTAADDRFVTGGGMHEVQYKRSADSTWLPAGLYAGADTSCYIHGVVDGDDYDVRVRAASSLGVRSAWVTVTGHTVVGKTAAPAAPSSLSATAQVEAIYLKWTNPTDADLAYIEILESTTNQIGDAVVYGRTAGDNFLRGGFSGGETRYYWVRAVDTSGNLSSAIGPQSATALAPSGGIQGPPGEDGEPGITGIVTHNNTLVWTKAANGGAWAPNTSDTTLTATFKQGSTQLAQRTLVVDFDDSAGVLSATGGTSSGITASVAGSGTAAMTVTFTHDASGATAIVVLTAVQGGAAGDDGTDGADGDDGLTSIEAAFAPGYVGGSGTIVFEPNKVTGGSANPGEIRVTGTLFNHPDGSAIAITNDRSIFTPFGDGGSRVGKAYVMYTATAPATRFGGSNWGDCAQFVPIIRNGSVWEAVDNSEVHYALTIAASDCIVAVFENEATTGGISRFTSLVAPLPGYRTALIYRRLASVPSTPTGDNPSGWTETIPSGTDPLWGSTGTKNAAGVLVGSWAAPVRVMGNAASFAEDKDGISTSILQVGDWCFDTTEDNRIYRWNGSVWEDRQKIIRMIDLPALGVGNLIANPQLVAGDVEWVKETSWSIANEPANAWRGDFVAKKSNAATGGALRTAKLFAVKPGDKFYLSAMVKKSADFDGTVFIGANCYTSAGSYVSTVGVGVTVGTSYAEVSGIITIPAGATIAVAQFEVYVQSGTHTSGTLYVGMVEARSAITAGMVGAEQIIAQTANIADGIITNAKIAALDAGKITTGTLDAARIAAGTITADKIGTGTIAAKDIALAGSGGVACSIRAGATSFASGTGWWLGVDTDGTSKFRVGNPAGNRITWDGSALAIVGTLTATSGQIGGWNVGATALTAGSGATTVGLDAGGTNPAFYAGSATPASAPFRVTTAGALVATNATITGAITASSGSIAGFTIAASTLTATNFSIDTSNKRLTLGTSNTVFIADADEGVWLGNAAMASAPFRVTTAGALTATSGQVGGWTLGATSLSGTNLTLNAAGTIVAQGVTIDGPNNRITVGSGSPNLVLDGANVRFRTSDFVAGSVGVQIDTTTAEFNNVVARGAIRSSVFVANEIHATGGTMLVATATKLREDATTVTSPSTSTIDVDDPPSGHAQVFAVNDILRIKDGSGLDNWLKVTAASDQTTFWRYTVEKQSGTNGTFRRGTAVVSYGPANTSTGRVMLTSDLSNAPYVDVFVNGTTPWTGVTTKARLGNLAGISDTINGQAVSGWGLYSDNAFLKGGIVATFGKVGGLTIDAAKLYVGAGNFGDADTAFYADNAGRLSLKDKFTWDGSALTVQGTIGTSGLAAGTGNDAIKLVAGELSLGLWRVINVNTGGVANRMEIRGGGFDIGFVGGKAGVFADSALNGGACVFAENYNNGSITYRASLTGYELVFGNASYLDTNLRRGAANLLLTDDSFEAVGTIKAGGGIAAFGGTPSDSYAFYASRRGGSSTEIKLASEGYPALTLAASRGDNQGGIIIGYKARGTLASGADVSANDVLLEVRGSGLKDGSYRTSGRLEFLAGATAAGVVSGRILLESADTAGTLQRRALITEDGRMIIGTGTYDGYWPSGVPALCAWEGYFCGAGQATTAFSTGGSLLGAVVARDASGSAGNGGAVVFGAYPGLFAAVKAGLTDAAGNSAGYLAISTRRSTADSTLTEALRVTPSGRLLVGTTSESGPLAGVAGFVRAQGFWAAADFTVPDSATTINQLGTSSGHTVGGASSSIVQLYVPVTAIGSSAYASLVGVSTDVRHGGTATCTTLSGITSYPRVTSSGGVTTMRAFSSYPLLSAGGGVSGSLTHYHAGGMSVTSTGDVTGKIAAFWAADCGRPSASAVYGVMIADQTASSAGTTAAFYSAVSAGSGKWGLYLTGTANSYLNGNLLLGTTDATGLSGVNMRIGGTGTLDFSGGTGRRIGLYGTTGYAIGVESGELRIATDTSAKIAFRVGGYSGTEYASVSSTGITINTGGVLKIGSDQVVGARQAHIPDGSVTTYTNLNFAGGDLIARSLLDAAFADLATKYNTLVSRFNSLLAALETHGLLASS